MHIYEVLFAYVSTEKREYLTVTSIVLHGILLSEVCQCLNANGLHEIVNEWFRYLGLHILYV